MKKKKKKLSIIFIAFIILLIGTTIFYLIYNKNYFHELTVDEVIEKIENKESFVLCISKTDCSHCKNYKPKLEKVSKKYRINIYYIDIDLYNDLTNFNKYIVVNSTPTTIFLINGEEKSTSTRLLGNVSESKIISKLKSNDFIK